MGKKLTDNRERVSQRPLGLHQRQWDFLDDKELNPSQQIRDLLDNLIKQVDPTYGKNDS